MRKLLKICAIVAACIIALLLIVEWIGSPIARQVIQNNSVSWIGREVTIDRLHINPFLGSIRIKGLRCSDAVSDTADAGNFISFGELYVQTSLFRLIGKNLYLRHIHLSDFEVNVWSNDTCFNFSDIPQRFASHDTLPEQPTDTTPSAWRISLNDIRLHAGRLSYADRKRDNRWAIENVNLIVPGLYFGDKQTDAGLSLDLPDGAGNLRLRGAYNMSSNDYSVIADIKDIDLSQLEPVVKEKLNIHSLQAWLNGHLVASGSLDEIMGVRVHGNIAMRDLDITDHHRNTILAMREMDVQVREICPGTQVFRFDTIALDSITLNFERNKGYTTLSRLLGQEDTEEDDELPDELEETDFYDISDTLQPVQEEPAPLPERRPTKLFVKQFSLRNTAVHYTDKSLFSRFNYDITGIRAAAKDMTLDGDNHLVINGFLPNGGSFMANWRGGMDFKRDNVRIIAMLKNVQLEDLSPWVEYLFAYKVKGGTLSLASDNTIRRGRIDATEKIDIHDFKLGKKNERLKAELKAVPLKLGVELLTDINGNIALNVPVTGDINSPKFSLGKIIGRTIGNILLKATAAPFVAIAQASDKDAGDLTQLELNLLQPDFSLEQYKKLDLLASMLKDHDDLALTLTQQFNMRQAVEERAVFKLKRAYYEQKNEPVGSGPLSIIDIEKISAVKTNAAFNAFAEPLIGSRGTLAERAVAYYGADSLAAEVIRFAEHRNRYVVRYLTEQQGVDRSRVEVFTAQHDILDAYKGRSRYEVQGKKQ